MSIGQPSMQSAVPSVSVSTSSGMPQPQTPGSVLSSSIGQQSSSSAPPLPPSPIGTQPPSARSGPSGPASPPPLELVPPDPDELEPLEPELGPEPETPALVSGMSPPSSIVFELSVSRSSE